MPYGYRAVLWLVVSAGLAGLLYLRVRLIHWWQAALNGFLAALGFKVLPGTRPIVPIMLGEAALAHRYAYEAGVDLILSETMTGHTSLLLAEGRGAAKAYKKPFLLMPATMERPCESENRIGELPQSESALAALKGICQ